MNGSPRVSDTICSVVLIGLFVTPGQCTFADPSFEDAVAPILIKRCVECHQGEAPSGGLLLINRDAALRGGDSGPSVVPGSAVDSMLVDRVVSGEMPPPEKGQARKLPAEEIEILRSWIDSGASWPESRTLDLFERTNEVRAGRDWWSLQPIVRPEVPQLQIFPQPKNPIDAFVLRMLEEQSFVPAPTANRRTLLRRLYYDLIGLPPTLQQIEQFEANPSADAFTREVDRLLESSHYGERWARYWLDLVRYAETSGYERDQEKPFAWKYRDWVVQALNRDMPFSDFIVHQLAGDEIEQRNEASVIATGFLRLGTWNDEPNEPLDYQYDRLEDLVHTTSSAFLGLTVKCARCHTHKFDPILQDDYYRMASAFWPGPIGTRDRKLLGGPSAAEVGFENVLAWTDLGSTAPPLHVLRNGERDNPLHEVVPATLSFLPDLESVLYPPPADSKTTHRRLQLAKWIASPENPLTPRVIVNRIWQHHFGQAIVRTPNNFGFLADPPAHPALLDWLAAEFLENGGSIKHIHRLIVHSSTWQQSAIHPEANAYSTIDAGNRLWWRFNRQRLDAESLRDAMLTVSGELNDSIGGPSFKPTISQEALEGLSRKSSDWQADPPEAQNRRSLYAYLKRGLLPPMMTAFDLCDATQSCGQRDVTTVPTQALAMLNNQFIHDRGQHIAGQLIMHHNSLNELAVSTWKQILCRNPTQDEIDLSIQHLNRQMKRLPAVPEPSNPKVSVSTDSVQQALTLHLRADNVQLDSTKQRIQRVLDLSGNGHDAVQDLPTAQPLPQYEVFGNRAAIRFNGRDQFLKIIGQPLQHQSVTVFCVANDVAQGGHREIISNWNSDGNVGSSLFLGLTDEDTVRFSDAFPAAGHVHNRNAPFILTAYSGTDGRAVFQNGSELASDSAALPPRRMDTEWVIGQQGNINGEFWNGAIAEIRVYNRSLTSSERRYIEEQLADRYSIKLLNSKQSAPLPSAKQLAVASLCHVLLNSNEFLYVD